MKQSLDYITNKEFDYSNDSTIDSRVLQVCAKAEADYLLSQSMSKSLSKEQKDELYFNKLNESTQRVHQSLQRNDNVQSKEISKPIEQFQHIEDFQINPNETIRMNRQNVSQPLIANPIASVSSQSIQPSTIPIKTPFNKNYNSVNLKLFQSKPTQKNHYQHVLTKENSQPKVYPHNRHITSKQKTDLNKTLLDAKTYMKKYKFISAYSILKSSIQLGIYHSDLFYLYGEVNRILKHFQEAEDYLLLALNFEMHSPYVFYSLGLLYQEVSQLKYSNSFFKLFLQLIDNANVHFQMAKNYSQIGKYIKTAEQLTKAININKEEVEYYKFRAEIYKLIGLTEMANDDEKMVQLILKSKYINN